MTQAMNKLYQRLEKDGWYCHLERDTLREVFWLAAEPPKGFSWSEMKAELWNYAKAESLIKRALDINEMALGPEHPDVGHTLNHLSTLYLTIGEYAKAESLLKRALSIDEKVFGPDHPNVLAG